MCAVQAKTAGFRSGKSQAKAAAIMHVSPAYVLQISALLKTAACVWDSEIPRMLTCACARCESLAVSNGT